MKKRIFCIILTLILLLGLLPAGVFAAEPDAAIQANAEKDLRYLALENENNGPHDLYYQQKILNPVTEDSFVLWYSGKNTNYPIVWSSSDPDLIAINDVTHMAELKRVPDEDRQVTLTATMSVPYANGSSETYPMTKELTLLVPCPATRLQMDFDALTITDPDDVRGNLPLLRKGKYGADIAWTSSRPAVISDDSPDSVLYDGGVVVRPEYGQAPVPVTLTATLTGAGKTLTKTFDVRVSPKPAPTAVRDHYLFVCYAENYDWNGDRLTTEEIYFGLSDNGMQWQNINVYTLNGREYTQPILRSTVGDMGTRDPHIVRSPDGDKFYVLATDLHAVGNPVPGREDAEFKRSSFDCVNGNKDLVIWETGDLTDWGEPRLVKCNFPSSGNTYAPEAVWDESKQAYLVYWASKDNAELNADGTYKPNKVGKIYYCYTRDFNTFSKPTLWLASTDDAMKNAFPNVSGEYDVYDTSIRYDPYDGLYYRFGTKNRLYVQTSESLDGPWSDAVAIPGPMNNGNIEAPTTYQLPDGTWMLLGDNYRQYVPYQAEHLADFVAGNYQARSFEYASNGPRYKHGTILPITAQEYDALITAFNNDLPVQDAPAEGEGFTVDDSARTIAVAEGYEVRAESPTGTPVATGSVTPWLGRTLYVRRSATEEARASGWTANEIQGGEPVEPPPAGPSYTLADSIEAGKTYVIVADGRYALSNEEVPGKAAYSGSSTTRGARAVDVDGGRIISTVTDDMLWTFEESTSAAAYDGQTQYSLRDASGKYLRRGSMSQRNAALILDDAMTNTARYYTWSFAPYEDGSGYAMYVNSERAYGNDYPGRVGADAAGFDIPGTLAHRTDENPFGFMNDEGCARIQLFELKTGGGTVTDVIDFTAAADAGKYEIVAQKQSAVEEGVGLALICSRMSIEPAKRPNSEQYIGPEDTVEIPVAPGDWTATLHLDYDPNNGGSSYAYFSFFASEGDDYQNMLGVRGGNSQMQNFERHDGTVTHEDEDDVSSAPGFAAGAGEYWFRIVKVGTSYFCYRSDDGETFDLMFAYEDSGIEATKLIADAYSASSSGNGRKFTLKTLTIERESDDCDHAYVDVVVEPTCYERGYTEHTCSKCGRVYRSDFTAILEHDWDESKTLVIPPTCTEQGHTERTCARCGDTFVFDVLDETLHDWPRSGVVVREPTETERGEQLVTCTKCGETKLRPIAAGNEQPHKNEILFISDVHSARNAEEGFHNLRAMMPAIRKEDNFIPEVISGGGDYIESSTNDTVYWPHCYEVLHDVLYSGFPNSYQTLTSGNHEWEWSRQSDEMIEKLLGEPRVCLGYESDDFAIFHIGAHQNGTGQEEFKDADIAKLREFLESQAGNGKILFVQTHWPLHNSYNNSWRTTKNAAKVVDLLNEFSDRNDVVFVWGHNHRTDSNRHKFYDRNDLLLIGPGEYKRIKFSYINAGCLNEGHSEQDYGPEGTKYGPGYCLETRILDGKIVLDYAHVYGAYPDPAQAKFDHNADLLYVDTLHEARESHHEIALLHTGACAHDYVKSYADPTCAEWGRDVYTCSKCGLRYEETVDGRDEPLGHIWDEGEITTAPTEDDPGVRTLRCSRCGGTKTERVRRIGSTLHDDVDFTTAYDAGKYEIVGQKQSAVEERTGLALTCTRMSIEPAKRPNSDQYIGAEDTVEIPLEPGDWSATLHLDYDPNNGGTNYAYFSFFAAEGDDYQNMLGIRGDNSRMQNFERHDGTVTHEDEDEVSSAPGFTNNPDEFWFRIVKDGDSYYCYRSDDGESFTEMFSYEGSGIEADKLIIDAYSASSSGNGRKFILKSLNFEEICPHQFTEFTHAPTCTQAGYTSRVCSICGAVRWTDDAAPLGHDFKDGKCTRCGTPEGGSGGAMVKEVREGGSYVIVSNGYALTNRDGAAAGTPVTVDGDSILSDVTEDMVWKFNKGESDRCGEFTTGYFLTNGDSGTILSRGSSGGSGTAPLNCSTYTAASAKEAGREYYCYWVVGNVDSDGSKGLFLYNDGSGEYAWAMRGGETFNAPGRSSSEVSSLIASNPLKLYEYTGQDGCRHEYTETVTAPTCDAKGFTTHTCTKCGRVFIDGELAPLGHDVQVTVTAPTCTEKGFTAYTCARCGARFQTAEKAALGHDYAAVVTAPTCTEAGFTTYTCARCGDSYKADAVDKLEHDFVDGKCTRCGADDPNVKPPFRFDDVKNESDYFFQPVYWAYEHDPQITKGTSDTLFSPNRGCTRAQVVTFLWRAMGEPEPEKKDNPFKDVAEGQYYYNAVLWAVEKGITTGTSATTFRPDQTCTRGQIVTFLWRAMGEPAPKETKNPFTDVPAGQYYYGAVLWAVESGVTTGTSATRFSPNSTCTRGQIVTFLWRALPEKAD